MDAGTDGRDGREAGAASGHAPEHVHGDPLEHAHGHAEAHPARHKHGHVHADPAAQGHGHPHADLAAHRHGPSPAEPAAALQADGAAGVLHPGHGHTHGIPSAVGPGAWRVLAVGSLVLAAVAAVELTAAALSHSAAILADGLHNLGDVSSTIALAVAFLLSRRRPTARFPYGYHRGEDVAGLLILALIAGSGVASGVTSVSHLLHPQPLAAPLLAFLVALVGFGGNEGVALYKTAAGRRLGSVALVADGRHSRADGLASLGAAAGVVGAWAGAPILDPVAGLVITAVIAAVVWQTGRDVGARLLDASDSAMVEAIADVAGGVGGVLGVTDVRARWTGRKLRAELVLAVSPDETVARAHGLGEEVRHALYHRIDALADVVVHIDPADVTDAAHELTRHHTASNEPRPAGS